MSQCGPSTNSPLGASGDVETQKTGPVQKYVYLLIWLHRVLTAAHGIFIAAHKLLALRQLSCFTACEILVPQSGIGLESPVLQCRFLSSGPPGTFQLGLFAIRVINPRAWGPSRGTLRDLELSRIYTKLSAADFSQTRHTRHREAPAEPWQVSSPLTSAVRPFKAAIAQLSF